MKRILISTKHPEESRVVITENGRLADFDHEVAGRENRKGDIYKGVVSRMEHSLEAAFVNFGDDKNGFLPFKDIPRSVFSTPANGADSAEPDPANANAAAGAAPMLKEGDSVLVQVGRDHISEKGAALNMNISLAGCYLVLMPLQPGGRQVTKQSDRRTRDEMMGRLRELDPPRGMSVILRTAGLGRSAEELRWDLDYLLKLWQALEDAGKNERGPILIYRENNLLLRTVRDHHRPDVAEVVCDNPADCEELRAFMSLVFPDQAERVKLDEGEIIGDALEGQIEEIFAREVEAPSGARVVFDTTEALVAIDVNSAKLRRGDNIEETALRANLAAAEVIARQLRLRDLGGLVVVDFIDMDNEKNRAQVEQHFRALLRKDRARVRTTEISRFGMMELSRQRLSQSVVDAHDRPCPRCNGSGVVRRDESFALTLLRRIRAQAGRGDGTVILTQAPEAAAVHLLNEKRADLRRLEEEFGREIIVLPDAEMHPPDCRIRLVRDAREAALPERNASGKMNEAREKLRAKRRERPRATLDTVMPDARDSAPTAPTAPADSVAKDSGKGAGAGGSGLGVLGKLKRLFFGEPEKVVKPEKPEKREEREPPEKRRGRGRTADSAPRERSRSPRSEEGREGRGDGRENRDGRGGREDREGRSGRGGKPRRNRRGGRRARAERAEQEQRESDGSAPEQKSAEKSAEKPERERERKSEKSSRPPRERPDESTQAEAPTDREVPTKREIPAGGEISAGGEIPTEREIPGGGKIPNGGEKAKAAETGMSAEFSPLPESDSGSDAAPDSRQRRRSRSGPKPGPSPESTESGPGPKPESGPGPSSDFSDSIPVSKPAESDANPPDPKPETAAQAKPESAAQADTKPAEKTPPEFPEVPPADSASAVPPPIQPARSAPPQPSGLRQVETRE